MKSKRIWMGRWLVAVAICHNVVGLALGGEVLLGLVERGVFNTVSDDDPLTGMVVWFMLFGVLLALLGMAVHAMERSGQLQGARAIGVGTALMTLLGVVLMPVSGFWLAFPPAIGLMRHRD